MFYSFNICTCVHVRVLIYLLTYNFGQAHQFYYVLATLVSFSRTKSNLQNAKFPL